jgi:hypothetical protein
VNEVDAPFASKALLCQKGPFGLRCHPPAATKTLSLGATDLAHPGDQVGRRFFPLYRHRSLKSGLRPTTFGAARLRENAHSIPVQNLAGLAAMVKNSYKVYGFSADRRA